MITAAIVSFALLVMAWLLAPADPTGETPTVAMPEESVAPAA